MGRGMPDQCVAESEWLGGSTVVKKTKQGVEEKGLREGDRVDEGRYGKEEMGVLL
jgi:hypothetical protein